MVRSHETSFIGCGSCSGWLKVCLLCVTEGVKIVIRPAAGICQYWTRSLLAQTGTTCFCLSTVGFSVTVELMLWQLWQHSPPFANSWHSYFHISGLPHFLLIKRMLSGCPTIGRGKLRGQSSSEHNKGSGGLWLQRQLNIPPPTLSRFVYCTLSFGFLPFMKGRWANSLQIQLEHLVI